MAKHIVCLTFDFDGISGWIARGQTTPSPVSRGEFGPRVGAPGLLEVFRRHGIRFVIIALAVTSAGALAVVGVAAWLKLPYPLAAGLFSGALTKTPALAEAIAAVERTAPGASGAVSVGYGIAYPLSMIGVVLLIQ